MQDVEKTEIQSQTSSKRRRRRNRFRPLYGLLVAILVIGVGVSLSMTVFFNIEQIVVAGDADQPYQKNDVVKASGVHTGDNMMRLNRETVKENILSRLIFVDSVSIQKDFPDRLVITIEPSKAAFNVTDSSGTLQVSAAGKILVSGPDSDPSCRRSPASKLPCGSRGKRWHRGTARRTRSFSPCPNGSPRGWTVR